MGYNRYTLKTGVLVKNGDSVTGSFPFSDKQWHVYSKIMKLKCENMEKEHGRVSYHFEGLRATYQEKMHNLDQNAPEKNKCRWCNTF